MDTAFDIDSFIVWLLTQLDCDHDEEREARVYKRVFSDSEEIKNDEQQ
ncbi:hypothetical protein [Ruminococcus sp. FC2018]|nr:hypothetical protein [Ruminococcus sp. FC2018]